MFTVIGGGAAAPDVINVGTGSNQLITTTAPNSSLQLIANPAGTTTVRVIAGSTKGQTFTFEDGGVMTSEGYSLALVAPAGIQSLEVDGSASDDDFKMARTAVGIPTTIKGGQGLDTYEAYAPLVVSSNVTFEPVSVRNGAILSEPSISDGAWHSYIGHGTVKRDGVAGFRYVGLAQLDLYTGGGNSLVVVSDAAGMSQLYVTAEGTTNVFQVSDNPNGLGMTAHASVSLATPQAGNSLFELAPDPTATYSVNGGPGFGGRLNLDLGPSSGAALTTTGPGGGKYTFASRQPVNFSGIGSVNDLPAPAVSSGFQATSPESLVFPFAADVGHSLEAGTLVLTNTTTGAVIRSPDLQLAYNSNTDTAAFTFPGFAGGVLPAGSYLARIPAGSITSTDGEVLAADDDLVFIQPLVVGSFVVNDGSAQRSMVTSLTVNFNEPVKLSPSAITVATNGGASVPFAISGSDDQSYVLSFGASLADGRYALTVHANAVGDTLGQAMPTDQAYSFFRLFGDYNGDGVVKFKNTFGKSSADPAFLSAFDYDNNGTINNSDFFQFKKRFRDEGMTTIHCRVSPTNPTVQTPGRDST